MNHLPASRSTDSSTRAPRPIRYRQSRPIARRHEQGQSLIEFSLMGIALVTILLGLVDLGRAYFTYLALKDAAAEGAYFGSVYPQCASVSGPCTAPDTVDYRIRNSSPKGSLVDWSSASITSTVPATTPGESITVTVSYQYQLITPVIGAIVGGQDLTLRARSVAVIVSDELP